MTSTLPPIVQALSGAIGSASANVLTYPLDLVTTRVQLDPPAKARRGVQRGLDIIRTIIRKHGLSALYHGIWADTGATILSNFLYFYVYSLLRLMSTRRVMWFRNARRIDTSKLPHKPSMAEELILGFVAGVASRAIATPLSIITLRLQTRGTEDDGECEDMDTRSSAGSVVQAIKEIHAGSGIQGFWRGFNMTILTSFNPSITLALLQLFRRLLSLTRHLRSGNPTSAIKNSISHADSAPVINLSPKQAFFGAAFSNAIAVTLLYPALLAKTRLQASSADSLGEVLADAYRGNGTFSATQRKFEANRPAHASRRGLYQGLEVQILKGFISQGVTFLVKGRIEEMIVNAYLRRRR